MSDAPIGIFDSGVGGLTVARAIIDQLPNERVLYVGDTAHSPYGPKPIADVRRYTLEVLDTMVEQGVKMLVIACNTASSAMLRDADIDTLVLGCTHYPLMSAAIQYVMGEGVTLVSSAQETASDVYRMLVKHDLQRTESSPPVHQFEATGASKADFLRLARRFLGPEVNTVELVETGTITLKMEETP